MAHAAPPPPLLCLQLQAGPHTWESLPRAARITATEGSIVVHQRLVLAGAWVQVPVVVRTGDALRVDTGGWVEIEATTAAQIRATTVPAWWRLALTRLRGSRARKQVSKLPQPV